MTELPTTFGKYYLTEKLAIGGMAEIYLAKIIGPGGFEKQLVIKQIHPTLTGQRQFVDMFVAEAKTLVTLAHGNIVPVYELGVVEDTYFIAMEYIDGPTLYRLTETMARREARMEPAVAAWIAARIIDGLDYAHRKGEGVIHRDLSPRNVMLSRDGEVKLVDFGIAVTHGNPGEDAARDDAPTGPFPYMSPEQARRESLTGQTDLFSAGVLLWEMLTGQRLFARPDADATLKAVQREVIQRPSSVRAEIPAKLDDVVMRALERDVTARWSMASDMLAALNKYLYSLDATPGPRDVAALVARFCPPETRRLPTHLEGTTADASGDESEEADERPAGSGPSTAIVPRGASAVSKGPSTALVPSPAAPRVAAAAPPAGRPQRQKSFATNVQLAPILDGTGPVAAIREQPAAAATASAPASAAGSDSDSASASASGSRAASVAPGRSKRLPAVEEPIEPQPTPDGSRSIPGSSAPGRGLLIVAGLGGIALAAGAVWMFYKGRDQVLHAGEDAAVIEQRDAAEGSDSTALAGPPVDASLTDAPPLIVTRIDGSARAPDASTETGSNATAEPRDAGVRRADAGTPPLQRVDAATSAAPDAAVRGNATLTVGADPWGEIYLDGKLVGRTPREVTVPAGHHTVEIVFPAETPPRKQTFAVDLAAGENKPLQADFRN